MWPDVARAIRGPENFGGAETRLVTVVVTGTTERSKSLLAVQSV